MNLGPDIIVVGRDPSDVLLVVEAKLQPDKARDAQRPLKEYMVSVNCPTGLLMSIRTVWIFRNEFTSRKEDSVNLVGEYVNDIMEFNMFREGDSRSEREFEALVRSWLEQMARDREVHASSSGLRQDLMSFVIPTLSVGEIRAAVPRE